MDYSGFFSMEFLYTLERLRNPVLNWLMQFFTYFGEELLFLVIALTVFWCVSKKEGYYLLSVGFVGTIVNQFLKLWYRIPRPWVRDPNFTVVESARGAATGYSFPSGHTQNAVGTFGSIARFTKSRRLRVAAIIFLLLTSFSRMYLGCHTPADVLVSFCIATVLVFAFYPLFRDLDEHPNRMYWLLSAFLLLAVGYLLFVKLYAFPADLDQNNYREGLKNAYSLLGALLGLLVVYPVERRYIRFETSAVWWAQLLKVVLGLAGALVIKEGLKAVFTAIFGAVLFPNLIRYFALVLYAGLLWPLTFRFFGALGRNTQK